MRAEDTPCMKRAYLLDEKESVEVRLWSPSLTGDEYETWACEHQIIGLGDEKRRTVYGGDAVQAVYLSLINIATTLYCSEEYQKGRLRWSGASPKFDLALPVADSIQDSVSQQILDLDKRFAESLQDR